MIITTRGIVLKVTKFRETSIIVKVFTEEKGVTSFIVNSVRSAKSKFKPSYFEPLSLIEIIGYYHPDRDINRISEIKSVAPLHSIRQDVYKSSIIMFLSEIVNKTVIEQDRNIPLFEFLFNGLLSFENTSQNNNFHLQCLLQLTAYLGFGLDDLKEFIAESPNKTFYDNTSNQTLLHNLLKASFESNIPLNNEQRSIILNDIIFYYQQHIGLGKLKSLEVLNTIFK